jgi:lipopolysaccharide/colanic/teichoic acid biosynthesis glycosyltransferase
MAKRLFDFFFATFGLIVTAPIFLVVALAIKLDSRGPVFFRHKRVGRYGVPFLMYKFRTMVENADSIGPAITTHADARITRVGRILRDAKLDELPQLINVWKGEMSMVGPRPEVAKYVSHYTPEQQEALMVKPGVTGPTQIEWRDEAARLQNIENIDEYYVQHILPQKLAVDLAYVRAPKSVRSDVGYIIQTFRALLKGNRE